MSAVYRSFAAFARGGRFLRSLHSRHRHARGCARRDRPVQTAKPRPAPSSCAPTSAGSISCIGEGRALSYPVGVGRAGRQWAGRAVISGKHVKPAWAPPPDIAKARPGLPASIAGGAPSNPMGAAALTLSGGDYAIHGTNDPSSIGGFVSYGCIRMHNQDITDLFDRVSVGTPVIVTR